MLVFVSVICLSFNFCLFSHVASFLLHIVEVVENRRCRHQTFQFVDVLLLYICHFASVADICNDWSLFLILLLCIVSANSSSTIVRECYLRRGVIQDKITCTQHLPNL